MTAAIKTLGRYMTDPRPDNVILRCSTKSRKDEWVWADIPPESWKIILELTRTEVGIFERRQKVFSPERAFVHGEVLVTYGKRRDGVTTWSTITPNSSGVDRPQTYVVCPFFPFRLTIQ